MSDRNDRLRVTVLSKALVVGAYQRKCELIAAHPEIDLTVLVPTQWGDAVAERTHTQGYTLRPLPIRLNGNFHLHHYPTLRRELALSKPDLFHIDEEPYNLATFLALRDFRAVAKSDAAPVASPQTLRGSARGSARQPKAIFFSWQNLLRQYPPPFRWMERWVLHNIDAAIVGNQEAQTVWGSKGFAKPMHVIPQFGVDEQHFASSAMAHPARPFTLGYAGRLVSEKGIALLIDTLAHLPAARLLIVGNGPEEAALRAHATQRHVLDRVDFRPAVPSHQMPAIYRAMDVLLLPSETRSNWKEQFGRVLIEAMACGVPVIGSDSGEIPHVIGDAGLIFPEGDGAALLAHLQALIQQPSLRESLAQRGHARVRDRFTMQRIADETVAFYGRVMAGK